jgi:hypothetical protein
MGPSHQAAAATSIATQSRTQPQHATQERGKKLAGRSCSR